MIAVSKWASVIQLLYHIRIICQYQVQCAWFTIFSHSCVFMLLLGCIYKSPSSSPENLDKLNKLLITVSKDKKLSHIMVMGQYQVQCAWFIIFSHSCVFQDMLEQIAISDTF
jgi:hypothetical protein